MNAIDPQGTLSSSLEKAIVALEESSISEPLQFKNDELRAKIPTISINTEVVEERWIRARTGCDRHRNII